MKKIISLLSVFAMVITMFSTIALADSNSLSWEVVSKDDTSIKLNLVLDTTVDYVGGKVNFKFADLNSDATITATSGEVGNFGYKRSVLGWSFGSTSAVSGKKTLGTVEITGITVESFKINVNTALELSDPNKNAVDVSGFVYGDTYAYTVKLGADVNYGVSAAQDYYYSADGGATKDIEVKAWDVVAENDGTGFVSLYFSSASEKVTNKKYTAKHSVEGETAVEFKALMLNAPADLTCALTAAN